MVVTHYNDICRKLFDKANYTNREKVKKYSMKMALIGKNGFLKRKKKTQIIVLYVAKNLKGARKILLTLLFNKI